MVEFIFSFNEVEEHKFLIHALNIQCTCFNSLQRRKYIYEIITVSLGSARLDLTGIGIACHPASPVSITHDICALKCNHLPITGAFKTNNISGFLL